MTKLIRLEKVDYPNVMHLFQNLPLGWDVTFHASQDYGFIIADDQIHPNVALAFLGGCVMYGGNAQHEAAKPLVHAMQIQPAILPYPVEWAALVKAEWGDKVQTMDRYFLPFSALDQEILHSISVHTDGEFQLKRVDEGLAEQLESELGEVYHLVHYASLHEFAEKGCGFCITRGDEICAATIAACRSDNAIQIQVNTKESYRRQGLATKTSAAMLRYCMEHGIRADWDASNPHSRDLAYKLGYKECTPYTALSILPE